MLFRNEFDFLSNLYPCKIFDNNTGCTFFSAEALFQAYKTTDPTIRAQFACLTGVQAKQLGRKIKLRPDWNRVKDKVMYAVLALKFEQNPDLREKLLATGNIQLVETNTWGDTYWGVCNGVGENRLGKLLMSLREEIDTARAYSRISTNPKW